MKIAVVGTGGVGGYFGGRLAAAGNAVTFVARGAHLEAIQRNGLTIRSSRGDLHLENIHAVESVRKIEAVDLILIAVKLWDTEDVAQALRPMAEEGTAVLSLQNGVEKDEVLRRILPTESILGGVCYISASIVSPGVVGHHGAIQRIAFGEYSGQESARTQTILEACRNAVIDADISLNIERLIWEKFVFLVGLSGTTTSMRQTIGSIRQNPRTRSLLLDLMREVVDLGRSRGVDLSEDYAADRLDFCDSLPASMTSSMHADLERGNRLELPWLSGGVVRLGKGHDVRTPLNRAVSDILEPFVLGSPQRI
ncbi:MAG: 2-dehydropantoate 2-reductase [Edaphobacter sp.]|nr:2-dehydropantoate 2-reductase [Edaphobacter sp.]